MGLPHGLRALLAKHLRQPAAVRQNRAQIPERLLIGVTYLFWRAVGETIFPRRREAATKKFSRVPAGDKVDVSRTSRAFFAPYRQAFPGRDQDPFDIAASRVKIGLSLIDYGCPMQEIRRA